MKKKIVSVLFALLPLLACAQVDSSRTTTINDLSLEELLELKVFSAAKKTQLESEAPAMITMIPQSSFKELGAVTLIDVLKFIPGVEVSMGSDGNYRIAIRGSRKAGNILVLINGQQINDFYSGSAIFDMPVDFIEKVEVIRGPGSAIYGSNAMAGVIHIFTISQTSASVTGGTNTTLSANVNYSTQKDKNKMNLSLGYFQSNGSRQLLDTDKVSNQSWSLTNLEKSYETNRWNKDAYLNCQLVSGDLHFQLFDIYRQQGTWVGPVYIAAPDSKLLTNQLATNLYYDYKVGDNIVITPKIYYNRNSHNFLKQEAPDKYISSLSGDLFEEGKLTHEKYTGTSYGSSLDIYIKANEHLDILTGSVFEDHSISDYELKRNYKIVGDQYKGNFGNYDDIKFTQNDKRRLVFAYFIQAGYRIKKFTVTAGLRYDDYSDFGQSANPRIGITYNASQHIRFKGLYGKAFRAPTFQELYDNSTTGNEYGTKGNTALTPEDINTFELAAEINIKKVIFKYNVYYTENNNLIRVYDPHGGGSIGIYENIGDVKTYGNGASVVVEIKEGFSVFANYSQFLSTFKWNEKNVRASDIAFYKKQPAYYRELRNIPTLRVNGGLSYTYRKFLFAAGLNYGNASENNKRFYLETDHYVRIPYYVQGNFTVRYAVTPKLTISLIGNNIGTKKFSDPEESTNINAFGLRGLIQPGPEVLLNIIYKFK
ncbi:MAG: TonB-dependent receptor [Bacteroidota bacterium]|jgi:iron complex outermembrane receptor protein|nr:TonB-dependent receptor [Bacteroidota bacterium]